MEKFKAYRIHEQPEHRAVIEELSLDDLNPGEVTVQTAWSSVNYKDALAGSGKGRILRKYPLVGGIDIAGTVIDSSDQRFSPGDEVLVTGCDLSETRDGGYSQIQRLESRWVVPVPEGLSMREAMGLGTAGFTAALSLYRMQANGQTPDMGPIVITGASGGVGTLAVDIFTRAGYEVHAITGKPDQFQMLQNLGARQCISRHDLYWGQRPLEKNLWAGALDTVGGEMLDGLTRVIKPWGNIASCGLAGGVELHTTVMPFIIRGISLIGINSSGCAYDLRETLWQLLASDWKPAQLDSIIGQEVELEQLDSVFSAMLAGKTTGRTVVRIGKDS